MIKRLNQFVEDANNMSWEQFLHAHDHHVVIIIPADETSAEPKDTSRFARAKEARPPINENYRVGVLLKHPGSVTNDPVIRLGRSSQCDIRLGDIEVSKVHALFDRIGGAWTIRDNASTNGTYVNGLRIPDDEPTRLRTADTIKFGPGLSAVYFDPNDFYQFLRSPEVQGAFLE